MADLPAGTVTFLLTDIAGSTRLWEQHPAAMRQALVRHDALVETVVVEHGGVVVRPRGEGDSRFAVFPRATEAVAAAAALQQALHAEPWPTSTPLRVRMGVHTGEADLRAGDYYGTAVNRCARLRAVAYGGQTLLSQATSDLVREHPLAGIELRDLGMHRLKDLQQPEHVFQLVAPGLAAEFPPLATLDARLTNLPVQPTPFIGRERDVAAVRQRLLDPTVRLLTLTGPGGTGKTRLALQVAAELLDAFADGVFFVNLAPLADPALVAPTIAQPLEVMELGGQPLLERLKTALHDRQRLLLLDNFEQVVEAAPLLAELVAAAPQLKLLVTSRAVLHLAAEHAYPVPPLDLPDPRHLPDLPQLSQYAAVALFIQRAQAIKPDFQVTPATAPAVAEICVRLEGLPLAIELAAARVKLLPPQALLARLSRRLQVLTGGARDRPPRQQTLRTTLDWSYHLLDTGEQTLLRRLGVFVGGCTLAAVEAVCNVNTDLPMEVLDGLQALLDKNLLRQDETGDAEPRFRMLETIREYAEERLLASGEMDVMWRRHAAFFLALAEEAEREFRGPQQLLWVQHLEREHDNLRAAVSWALERGETQQALQFCIALHPLWVSHGYWSEARSWLDTALAAAGTATAPGSSSLRAHALMLAAGLAQAQSDFARADVLLEEGLAVYRALGEPAGVAWALLHLAEAAGRRGDQAREQALREESLALFHTLPAQADSARLLGELSSLARRSGDAWPGEEAYLEVRLAIARMVRDTREIARALWEMGSTERFRGEHARARALLEESLAIFRDLEDRAGSAAGLRELGATVREQGEYGRAQALLEESVALWRALGDKPDLAVTLHDLGETLLLQGDDGRTVALEQESLALQRELGNAYDTTWPLLNLGHVAKHQGEYARAACSLAEALAIVSAWGHRLGIAICLSALAGVASAASQPVRAARLFGAAEALFTVLHEEPARVHRVEAERDVAGARAQVAEATWTAAWAEGSAMPLDVAIAYALQGGS